MFVFFTIVHVLLCVFMIFVILLQPGKDAGMGAALGGGAATTAFGGRGAATFLTKLTAFCAIAFFFTSLGLSFADSKASIGDEAASLSAATPAPAPAPGTDAVPAAAPTAAPSTPSEATPKPTDSAAQPSPADAVPAEKLPGN